MPVAGAVHSITSGNSQCRRTKPSTAWSLCHVPDGGSRRAPRPVPGNPAADRRTATTSSRNGLSEGEENVEFEGEVCPDEANSARNGPPQVVSPPDPVPFRQERSSWFPDPACSAIFRASSKRGLGNVCQILQRTAGRASPIKNSDARSSGGIANQHSPIRMSELAS